MRSLVVTTPAADITLLTIAELRAAAGLAVGDTSRDAELTALETRIAAAITSECNVAVGAGAPPTLRAETLTETIYDEMCGGELFLSRRHQVAITSLSVDGSAVSGSDLIVNAESGIVLRQSGSCVVPWWGRKAIVVYTAGFSTVPNDLKQAALDFFRGVLAEADRDPFVKSLTEDVAGVGSRTREFWVGSVPGQMGEGAVPEVVAGQLKRFRNSVVA